MKSIITKKQFYNTLEFFSNDNRFKLTISQYLSPKQEPLIIYYHFQSKNKKFTLIHLLDNNSYHYTD